MVRRDDDLAGWLRKQMAADETKIRGAMYTARQAGGAVPLETIEALGELESNRAQLDTMGSLELRTFGARYAERDGYLEAWRP